MKVERSAGPDACWPWLAGRDEHGYGKIWIGSKADGTWRKAKAARVAFFLHHGEWPNDQVCHSCDNPPCCNPAHLFDGTQTDNMRDAASKGRLPGPGISGDRHYLRQKTHCKNGHPFDEANTRWLKDGVRDCRTCCRERLRLWVVRNPERHAAMRQAIDQRFRARHKHS